ncbi:MAG: FtsX-like permease family protein [Verrucomicrobiota bacterium]
MTFRTLIQRSLRFHWRSHVGVVLGAAIGSAALIGALVVGDSVRESLRDRAIQRLGWVDSALDGGDRFFTQKLAERVVPINRAVPSAISSWNFDAVLKLPGTATRQDGSARANQITVLGVGYWSFWQSTRNTNERPAFALIPKGSVVLNAPLATQLRVEPGDEIILRLPKPSALSREAIISPRSQASVALRLKVHGIAPASYLGNFSLRSGATPPLNAFLLINDLAPAVGLADKANMILVGDMRTHQQSGLSSRLSTWWQTIQSHLPGYKPISRMAVSREIPLTDGQIAWRPKLADFSLTLRALTNSVSWELRSDRIFIDPPVNTAVFMSNTNRSSVEPLPLWAATWANSESAATNLLSEQFLAAQARPILTYLVNLLRAGTNATPYSMVTAAGAPWTPADLRDDEIVINQWLADDLNVKPGDAIAMSYFLPESGARLEEATNTFRVHSIVPLEMPWADRTLMPDFPGIEKAESTSEWDAGFPLTYKVRPKDDEYWKQHRGTPKAFITLAAGQKMWGNRFGNLTAIRFPIPANLAGTGSTSSQTSSSKSGDAVERVPTTVEEFRSALERKILSHLKPEELGLRFEPVREQALKAAAESQDFGGLFLGFSFFLIIAALLLMTLLFQLGLEQRAPEIGTLLALGFTPKQVRSLWLREGVALAFIGSVLGTIGGLFYARAMLQGLTTIWRDAVGASALSFHFTGQTLVIGLFASVVVSVITIWLSLRKFVKRPARELLVGEIGSEQFKARSLRPKLIGAGALLAALSLAGFAVAKGDTSNAGIFFGAGALVLVAGLNFSSGWLARLGGAPNSSSTRPGSEREHAAQESGAPITFGSLAVRGCARRRKRSLSTMAMLACGSFLIVSIGVFRLDANRDATKKTSGTGGFALIGETTMPVVQDLNSEAGRAFFALNERNLDGVSFVPFRVKEGDEASCLNLNRAQRPRLLGVKPELLDGRFSFADMIHGPPRDLKWNLLRSPPEGMQFGSEVPLVPAIGDANSVQWALGKKLGDTIDFTDAQGRPFKVWIVATVANSILQGNLLIDEAEFVKRFPGESGYRMFLMDAPSNAVSQVSATLSRAMQDVGLELTSAAQRLAQFNAVQNTYLGTFQVLGGLGLLLGSVGLGIVVLRNVLERRGELAVLMAVGFRKPQVQWLLFTENTTLLVAGLTLGVIAAAVAVTPALLSPNSQLPVGSLALTLGAVLLNGLVWTWAATKLALRGDLLVALRNE